jgi:hypothetical protein
MSNQQTAWTLLTEAIGGYQGEGVNHEKQNFTGKLKLEYAFEKKLLFLSSSAIGKSGEVYHNEHSWIGNDIMGSLTLYVNSTNHPGVAPHIFDRIEEGSEGQKIIIFRFGDIDDRNSFREEISVALFKDKSLEHFYSWGLPGGDFQKRSGSRMKRLE